MKINGRDVDVRKFTWSEAGGELHIDLIKLMHELDIPWSEANERRVARDVMRALAALAPNIPVNHLVDRKPPVRPRGN